MEDDTETICRICGYDDELFWEGGWPTAFICPCCGNESDVGDASVMSLRNYRGYWVRHGAQWHDSLEECKRKLQGWDLLKQMANIPPEWR
ncbi:hypothetical protein [Streptomyces natalensis]|uniref:Uncharacterized protein n=1 Tax=Streptomyces natalensis ATCC 27448 TaxID=1240678 RepID=A0A0D7CIR5_9ACTN|nr:hypothetical protein [Streptomyces natalensis]KIZ15302.1 hypothetical protein SNA_27375 [Streptomyces natalensis ATCC 27448]